MQTQGNGALPHEEARQGANPKEAVALLAELLGQLGDVLGHDLFNLGNVLVGDDLLASLLVDDFLSLVEALLNGTLDIEAHGGLLSALSRSKTSPWVRGLPGAGRKLECDALVDETCKLGLYVTVEPSVDAIHMPDYSASKLYSSRIASVDKCTYPRGQEKPPSENVAPLLTNDQKIMAYQRVITGE